MKNVEWFDEQSSVFSPDCESWNCSDGVGRAIEWMQSNRLTKLTVGKLESDAVNIPLPDALKNLADLFPNLTHLSLWGWSSLTILPSLPAGLVSLDVRHCSALVELGSLPNHLKSLDLGGCVSIEYIDRPPNTTLRCYLNDCTKLSSIRLPLYLEELDGSRCPAFRTLKSLPTSLQKIVLEECELLDSLEGLSEFSELKHLNLSDCTSLRELDKLPEKLDYLELRGCDKLTGFLNQTIGPYDRGSEKNPNVIDRLRVREVLGAELESSAQAKLLLMGDGRVGKTTLAKSLQWNDLSSDDRSSGQYSHIEPSNEEKFTHSIGFFPWSTPLKIPSEELDDIAQRSLTANIPNLVDKHGYCDGLVRVWDFAGQEIYYETHRIFAAEGSVFLIAWTAEQRPELQDRQEDQGHLSDQEWAEVNRPHALDYWIDYIDSIRPDAEVALVCTYWQPGTPPPEWTANSVKHKKRSLRCFYVDSLNPRLSVEGSGHEGFIELTEYIREACGREAARLGVVQPKLYSDVRNELDRILHLNDESRANHLRPSERLYTNEQWAQKISSIHGEFLAPKYTDAITGYLHDAGIIHRIAEQDQLSVLIDYEWVTDIVYSLLQPSDRYGLFHAIRLAGGYFSSELLKHSPIFSDRLGSDAERAFVLQFMQECKLFIKLLDRSKSRRQDEDLYLATGKWLLKPETDYDIVQRLKIYQHIKSQANIENVEFSFNGQKISAFEFRSLMGHLAHRFGLNADYFRTGIQLKDSSSNPSCCCLIQWSAISEDEFYGTLEAKLTALTEEQKENITREIELLVRDAQSPLHAVEYKRHHVSSEDLSELMFPKRSNAPDLAISHSGADRETIGELVKDLEERGIRVRWFGNPETLEESETLRVMKELQTADCLLLVFSPSYFNVEDTNKLYCMYELAETINGLAKGTRDINKTLVTYLNRSDAFNSANIIEIVSSSLETVGSNYYQKSSDVNTDDYRWLANEILDAVRCNLKKSGLLKQRGFLGEYSSYTGSSSEDEKSNIVNTDDWALVIQDIEKALSV